MMEKNLELALAWLGLDQYYERFMHAGFDSWETVLEITEYDLEVSKRHWISRPLLDYSINAVL